MSMQTSVTVYLAHRQRLFRELLQHALTTASSRFRVVEAGDAMPSPSVLNNTDWLIVDEDTVSGAAKLANSYPQLGILAIEGRGSRVRIIAPAARAQENASVEIPTLSQLFDLMSQVVAQPVGQKVDQKESQH